MPTFQRLREKHPDAEMKWFARGKLWASPEAARPPRVDRRDRAADSAQRASGRHEGDRHGRPPGRREREPRGEVRGRDWRPGGDHRDPRQQFKDAKKARNERWRKERFERKQGRGDTRASQQDRSSEQRGGFARRDARPFDAARGRPRDAAQGKPPREKPHGDKFAPRGDRPYRPKGNDRGGRPSRPRADAAGAKSAAPRDDWRKGLPRDSWRDAPREKPHGDKLRAASATRPFSAGGRFARGDKRARRFDASDADAASRGQGTEEPNAPPRPRGPNREPRPSDSPPPSSPPRPSEPAIPPPGPPERGRLNRNRE
jgi:hypothetical protein